MTKPSDNYKIPTEPPIIPEGATIGIDTETFCEDLKKKGQQFLHGKDYVIGYSIAREDGYKDYFPVKHANGGNCEWDVTGFVKDLMKRPDLTAVGANWKFDIEGMYKEGIEPKCKLVDMQVTEALLDENQTSYSLNNISKRRGLGEKTPGEMEEKLVALGYIAKGEPDWKMMYKLPPKYVGPYAADDAWLTLTNHMHQIKEIEEQGLQKVFDLESELIPILFEMRRVGQPVDVDSADELNGMMGLELEDKYIDIVKNANAGEVDPFSSQSLGQWVKKIGYLPPQTKKENDSVSNEWLMSTQDPNLVAMAEYRQAERFRRDVIQGVILDQSYKGRIHASWYSTRGTSFMAGEDGGTRSGRLSSGAPSLQVIPARHPVHGPLVRKLFLPEQGQRFYKGDYNSQEIRIAVHFAWLLKLTGADYYYNMYNENPAFDYHESVKELINTVLLTPVTRGTAKTTGLSLQYGMGLAKLAVRLGMTVTEAKAFLEAFHSKVPWIKEALNKAMDVANSRGFVRSILGRRRRFDEWENATYGAKWEKPISNKKIALLTWGKIKRAGTYKAWNSIIQGSAAEQTKMSMVNCYKEGILPRMTIHDELTSSVDSEVQAKRMKEIMEHSVKLCIPVLVDTTIADDWAGTNKVVIQ